ncbi:porin family protein [Flavobacterium sp. H122]|uniref:porin family protein n=1 Tax=Flavobacterium sp. H122 TaxID=2529860 RepID=UPI0010A9D11D|nr:porin family protein [Flavobacterium sp. H122]
MKNLIFLTLIILCSANVNAQKKIHYGIKGGFNLTNLTSDYFAENNTKTGYYLGGLIEFSMSKKFSIQPEILYTNQGTNAKVIMLGSEPKSQKYSLDYLQFPILSKIYLLQNFSIEIGPSFNFLVNDNISDYESKLLNNFEFGGAFGISYKLNNSLFSNIKYNQGFTNVFDKENYLSSSKLYGFHLGIGYMF